jgi:hypothetical protein
VKCSFPLLDKASASSTKIKVNLYVVGDLVFYGMILGREDHIGDYCYLCKLSQADFRDLFKTASV